MQRRFGGVFESALQFVVGTAAFAVCLWIERIHVVELIRLMFPNRPGICHLARLAVRAGLIIVASACLIDPFAAGYAQLRVLVESRAYPETTLMENLLLRVTPTGVTGSEGGEHIRNVAFDKSGSADASIQMTFLMTAVRLELYDRTRPKEILRGETVYLSPFVRRALLSRTYVFREKEMR